MKYHQWMLLGVMVSGCWLAGCTLQQYGEQADKTAYRTIHGGQRKTFGETDGFDVLYDPLPGTRSGELKLEDRTIRLFGAKIEALSLDDALQIAFRNSRSYQDRKEALYVQALSLANNRRSWNLPLFDGPLDAEAEWEKDGLPKKTNKVVAASAELSLLQRFVHGGVLTLGVMMDMATDLLGSQSLSMGSLLDANFTQPLLRGGWHGFAYEEQYRLERDFLFSVFSYARYRQEFAVGVISGYYDVLRQRDQIENDKANIERLETTRDVTRVLVQGGQAKQIDLDQAEQDLLSAQIRLTGTRQTYQNALDAFKISLGLPVLSNVEPAYPAALEVLRKNKPDKKDIPFDETKAIQVALEVRPDVLSQRATVRDAERDVELAADDFLPQLDLEAGFEMSSPENSRDFYKFQFHRHKRFAKLTFNYNIDQTDNRDSYRTSVIDLAKARRDYQEFEDQVRLDVRQNFRSLERSRLSYELQLMNVAIAERRTTLARQQQKGGEASTRDVLEAEAALLAAQNGLTGALISYTNTRLQFLASLGMLQVKDKGQIHERGKPSTFERIRQRYPYTGFDPSEGLGQKAIDIDHIESDTTP